MILTKRVKQNAFIRSMHDLWTWKTAERNLLIQWHEFLNGNHPYVVANFLGAEKFGNPRSNETIFKSFREQCEETEMIIRPDPPRWFIGDSENNFHFNADVTCMFLVPGSKTEWLLILEGNLQRRGFDGGETPAKMACYYDTSRGEGFALMPNLAREQLYSNPAGR